MSCARSPTCARPATPPASSPPCSASRSCAPAPGEVRPVRRPHAVHRGGSRAGDPAEGRGTARRSVSARGAQMDRRPRLRHRRGRPGHRRARPRGDRRRARRGDRRDRRLQPRPVVERPSRARHAEDFDLAGVDGVYLDPARRTGGKRLTNPADWSPSLDFAFDLAERLPIGVKLGPGIDRDLIPADAEAQWVSVDRDVVELGLWFGALARPGIRRSALVVHGSGQCRARRRGRQRGCRGGPAGAVPLRAGRCGHPRPSHRRPGPAARRPDARPHDRLPHRRQPAETPFASCFRVIEDFPLDERLLKRELAARGIGTLEIKKRGVDIDPAAFRTALNPRATARPRSSSRGSRASGAASSPSG